MFEFLTKWKNFQIALKIQQRNKNEHDQSS